jgi:hypothetical protein
MQSISIGKNMEGRRTNQIGKGLLFACLFYSHLQVSPVITGTSLYTLFLHLLTDYILSVIDTTCFQSLVTDLIFLSITTFPLSIFTTVLPQHDIYI